MSFVKVVSEKQAKAVVDAQKAWKGMQSSDPEERRKARETFEKACTAYIEKENSQNTTAEPKVNIEDAAEKMKASVSLSLSELHWASYVVIQAKLSGVSPKEWLANSVLAEDVNDVSKLMQAGKKGKYIDPNMDPRSSRVYVYAKWMDNFLTDTQLVHISCRSKIYRQSTDKSGEYG